MRTAATDLFDIDLPLFAFSHCRDVVAAVTNAGGVGVLGAVAHSPERLETDLRWIEAEVRGRPYGVDLLLPQRYVGNDAGGFDRDALSALVPDAHREWLEELLDRYGVPPLPDGVDEPRTVGGMRVDTPGVEALVDVTFAHDARLIASALGPPPEHLVERAHDDGRLVAALAGTVDHAIGHRAAGADLIIAQGTEAGGHTGQIATMVLVPEVVDAVAPTPVLAAGGIANGRQMAAALALGAEGVWTGSVWLMTEEAETPPAVQAKYAVARSADTVRSRSITGKPARMLRTAWTDEWDRDDTPDPLPMPLQPMLVDEPMSRINRVAHHEGSGANALATYFVGQVVGGLTSVRPARRVVLEMVEELVDTLDRLERLADGDSGDR